MKKNIKTILILVLSLVFVAMAVALVACTKDDEPTTVTLTVDYGLEGVANDIFTVDVGKPYFDKLSEPASEFTFNGWFTSDGNEVTASTVAPKSNFTVKAKWLAIYRIEYWLQAIDGQFVLDTNLTIDSVGELGSTLTAEIKSVSGFTYDQSNASNVTSAVLNANGTTLKLYYTRNQVTLKFDKNLSKTAVTGEMANVTVPYGSTVKLVANTFASKFTFVGWNTASDGSGDFVEDEGSIKLNGPMTLYAQWQTEYSVQLYVESLEDGFELYGEPQTLTGIIGHPVTQQVDNPNSVMYELDEAQSELNKKVSEDDGMTVKVYFALKTFTIHYMDDDHEDKVKYGAEYTVRTPDNTNPNYRVESYCEDSLGNATDHPFGDVIASVTRNYTLYPMGVEIYFDVDDSGDTVEINSRKSGLYGEATLVRDGVRYEGRLHVNSSQIVEFYVEVEENMVYGGLYADYFLFQYRNDGEEGLYIYYDVVARDYRTMYVYLDGYGSGIMMSFAADGTERYYSFYVFYEINEGSYDYTIDIYYADGSYYGWTYFMISPNLPEGFEQTPVEGYEDYVVKGIYMFQGDEAWYSYGLYLYANGEVVQEVGLFVDGYGYAEYYEYNSETDTFEVVASGTYYIYDYSSTTTEFYFDGDNYSFYFICLYQQDGDSIYGFFMIRGEEVGDYTMDEDTEYPQLYLDGYDIAMFFADEDDVGRIGLYTIEEQGDLLIVTIEFKDDIGGSLVVAINVETHIFTIVSDGDFVVVDGLLTAYLGSASVVVIPDGVTEIAAEVFKDINITSVTFPESLVKIGDYAFQNSSASGASALRVAYFLSTTPPELGEDVFRWVLGSFKIYVPDGYEYYYRNADSWTYSPSQKDGGYAKFVTSMAEQADKPLYYIVDGVLLSYNNREENPSNVEIDIPEEATSIAAGVFGNLDYIVSVKLNNVTVIGDGAFRGCYNIKSVTFNPNTEYIGARAFYECYGLTSVNLYEIKEIGAEAFSRCLGLSEVTIGSSIKSIGEFAFYECAREEYYYEQDGDVLVGTRQYELVVNIAATKAPKMGTYVFQGSTPRIYVASYEVALNYVNTESWLTYFMHIRLKATEEQTWYSKSGLKLELSDLVLFNDTHTGFYKWEGNKLYVAWFIYTDIANQKSVYEQTATLGANGELVGINFEWYDDYNTYTFVIEGTELTYTYDNEGTTEKLVITFGESQAMFNDTAVELETVNYRLQFTLDGYIYKLTLANDQTFYYSSTKITVVTTFRADDGSEITLYDGAYNKYVLGTLNDVDGQPLSAQYAYSWTIYKLDDNNDNAYYFNFNHARGNFLVILYLDPATATFEYEWSIDSKVYVYHDEKENVVSVTVSSDGTIKSIVILFKTSNGTDDQKAVFTEVSDNVYKVVIDGTFTLYDDNDNPYEVPSYFNGTYLLMLNPEDMTFTLVEVNS